MEQPILAFSPSTSQSMKERSSNSPDPPPPNRGIQYKKRGKITVVACIPCRKRKSKCDGKRPTCTPCTAREGQVCQYDMTVEQRRLTVMREQIGNVSEEKSTLESIVYTLQTASEQDAIEVMRRLRAGVDVNQLAQQLHAVQLLTGVGRESTGGDLTPPSGRNEYSPSHDIPYVPSPQSFSPLRTDNNESLVTFLSTCSPSESEEINRRLQAGEDAAVILVALTSGTLKPQLQQATVTMAGIEEDYSARDQAFGKVGDFVRQAAGGSHSQPGATQLAGSALLWTSVTNDVEYIDHLMALYFSYLHPLFQSFREDDFRADLVTGSTKHCSSFLVNAICAAGCTLSERSIARRNPLDYRTAGLDFFEEASRLLHKRDDTTLTSVAAAYILSHVEGARGRLSSMWCFVGQSGRMALDIKLHLRVEENGETAAEKRSRLHTFWGCFIGDLIASFTFRRLPQFQTNSITVELPQIWHEDDLLPWHGQSGAQAFGGPSYQSTVFYELARLSKVVGSTLNLFFAPSRTMCGALYLDEYQKYLDWRGRLPPTILPTENAPPHVLSLHIYYQAAVLHLFRPLLRAHFTISSISPRQICRASADAICELFAQYKRLVGLNGICTYQLNCLLSACSVHLMNLPAVQPTKYLTDALNTFQDMAFSNAWASASLNTLADLAVRWLIPLPMEVEMALNRNGNRSMQPPIMQLSNPLFFRDDNSPNPMPMGASSRHSVAGRPGKRPRVGSERSDSRSDYLFESFPDQQAPLPGPRHTSFSDDIDWDNTIGIQPQEFDGLDFNVDPYFGFFPSGDYEDEQGTHS